MHKLDEEDLDHGYCPFCGVFVDGTVEDHWCPEWEDGLDYIEEDIEYDEGKADV